MKQLRHLTPEQEKEISQIEFLANSLAELESIMDDFCEKGIREKGVDFSRQSNMQFILQCNSLMENICDLLESPSDEGIEALKPRIDEFVSQQRQELHPEIQKSANGDVFQQFERRMTYRTHERGHVYVLRYAAGYGRHINDLVHVGVSIQEENSTNEDPIRLLVVIFADQDYSTVQTMLQREIESHMSDDESCKYLWTLVTLPVKSTVSDLLCAVSRANGIGESTDIIVIEDIRYLEPNIKSEDICENWIHVAGDLKDLAESENGKYIVTAHPMNRTEARKLSEAGTYGYWQAI